MIAKEIFYPLTRIFRPRSNFSTNNLIINSTVDRETSRDKFFFIIYSAIEEREKFCMEFKETKFTSKK